VGTLLSGGSKFSNEINSSRGISSWGRHYLYLGG
jgi:hypothetical protein